MTTFPHLVYKSNGNSYFPIIAENNLPKKPARGRYVYYMQGMRLADGSISPAGKHHIIEDLRKEGSTFRYPMCLVWSPEACTYILANGKTYDGRVPPNGNSLNVVHYETPITLKQVKAIALPEGYPWPYICIRRLGDDYVEIASGAPMRLGNFRHVPRTGTGRKLLRHFDDNGQLIQPVEFRGVTTTGIFNETVLLGPVQPDGGAQVVVARWPQLVFDAARKLAGRGIPPHILDALWKAVE